MPADDDVDVHSTPKSWDHNGILTAGEQVTVLFTALREHVNNDLSRIHGQDCEVCAGGSMFKPVPPALARPAVPAPVTPEPVPGPSNESCFCGRRWGYTHYNLVDQPTLLDEGGQGRVGYRWCAECASSIQRSSQTTGVFRGWQLAPIPSPVAQVDPDLERMIQEEEEIERQRQEASEQEASEQNGINGKCANCHNHYFLTHRVTRFRLRRWTDDRICTTCANYLTTERSYRAEPITACPQCGTMDHPFTHIFTAWPDYSHLRRESWERRRICSAHTGDIWFTRGLYTIVPIEEVPQP